jgi:transcription elongation GreA/GreB family factor
LGRPLFLSVGACVKYKARMTKADLLKKIIEALKEKLGVLDNAARASHAEATHESSKAENKYDTRGLEAAYLAGGQARQSREILDSIADYESLALRDFKRNDVIDLTALVEVEMDSASFWFFIGPRNGGLEVETEVGEVTVITPQSPLGKNLIGKKAGDNWTAKMGGAISKYRVVSVR